MYICSIIQHTNRLMSAPRSPVRVKRGSNPKREEQIFGYRKLAHLSLFL